MEEELVSQIDRLINMYQWSMGTFIAILALVLGFIGILQWRLSSKQIQRIQTDIENELIKNHKIDLIDTIRDENKDLNEKIDNLILNTLRISNLSETRSYKLQSFEEISSNVVFNSTLLLSNFPSEAPDRVVKSILSNMLKLRDLEKIKDNEDDKEMFTIFIALLNSKSSKQIKTTDDYISLKNRLN